MKIENKKMSKKETITIKVLNFKTLDYQDDIFEGNMFPIERIPVFRDFDQSKVIGIVDNIRMNCYALYVSIKEPDFPYLDLYPAIGFEILKYSFVANKRFIEEFRLWCIGLCTTRNADPNIKTIREQLNEKDQ